jgi:hypothetical protein
MSEMVSSEQAAADLALAVDYYVRYPSEPVKVFVRFTVPAQPGCQVQVTLPDVILVDGFSGPESLDSAGPQVIEADQMRILQIELDKGFTAGVPMTWKSAVTFSPSTLTIIW